MEAFDPAWPRPVRAFMADTVQRARHWGVSCLLHPESTVGYASQPSLRVSGYFVVAPAPTLAVATGQPMEDWFPVFVHEACHMAQWKEQHAAWLGNFMPDGLEAVDWLDQWCQGSRVLDETQLRDVVSRAKAVEMDCERRVLEQIERYGLPIDVPAYARKANAYVHFYEHVARTGQWYPPGRAPYQLPEVWMSAPDRLSDQAPRQLQEAFDRHYPVPRPRPPRP